MPDAATSGASNPTVLVAFISAYSVILGALISAVATWLLARRTAASEMKKQLRSERIIAYSNYLSVYFKYIVVFGPASSLYNSTPTLKADLLHELGSAHSGALIVASSKTQAALLTLTDNCLAHKNGDDPPSGYNDLISCIHEELQIPT